MNRIEKAFCSRSRRDTEGVRPIFFVFVFTGGEY